MPFAMTSVRERRLRELSLSPGMAERPATNSRHLTAASVALVALIAASTEVLAAEGGSTVYLLGARAAAAGVTPPPGVFF